MVSLPNILFRIATVLEVIQEMGDTEYMAKKAFDGKLITVTGAIDALNDTIEFVVPNGKRFYFHSAKIVISDHVVSPAADASAEDRVKAALKIDGVTKDTTNIGVAMRIATREHTNAAFTGGGTGTGTIGDGKFDVKGLSLIGDGAKKIEIENILDGGGSAVATFIGFIEDTASDPTILASSITVDATVAGDTGDFAFLREKELAGDLIHLISSEFTGDADQITFIPASGKTFFHLKSKLYPVVNSIKTGASGSFVTESRRADVELTFDAVIKDVLTHDMQTTHGTNASGATGSEGNAGQAGQYETNIFESMVGDGVKAIKLTSTSNVGTYRVSLLGWTENT